MKAAIVIDNWKLSIFEQYLTNGGYSYVKHPGINEDTLTLTVISDDVNKLGKVVRAANIEAAAKKGSAGNA